MHGIYYGYSLVTIRKKESESLKNKLNCQNKKSSELVISSIDNSYPTRRKQNNIEYIENKIDSNLENNMQNYTKFDELLALKNN